MSSGDGRSVRFTWRQLSVVAAVLAVVIGGTVAWGQTKQRAEHNTERIDDLEDALGTIAEQLRRQTGTLERLDERSANTAATQRRILDALEDLGREMRARRPAP